MKKLFWIFCFFLFAINSFAINYYCDPSVGNMTNNGSINSPWSTLQAVFAANKVFVPGDVIFLRSGFHGTPIVKGINSGYVTIQPDTDATPNLQKLIVQNASKWIITGLTISPEFVGSYSNLNVNYTELRSSASFITLQNCFIYSTLDPTGWSQADWENMGNAIRCDAPNCLITNNHIKNINFGIDLNKTALYSVVSYNTIENIGGDALRGLSNYGKFEYNLIKNFYIQNSNHDDIFQSWSTDSNGTVGAGFVIGVEVRGNICISHTDANQFSNLVSFPQGIGCYDGFAQDWIVENNLVIIEHYHAISFFGAINCKFLNNTVVENPLNLETTVNMVPWINITNHKTLGPSSGNLVRNNITPQITSITNSTSTVDSNIISNAYSSNFVNYAAFDFHLKSGSPAIGVGSSNLTPSIDLEQLLRTIPYDVGCYKYISNPDCSIPPAPPIVNSQTFCNSATVANLTASGSSIKWYTSSTGGSVLPLVTALVTGTYYASQTILGCESPRVAVSITISLTAQPIATTQTLCSGATVSNLSVVGTAIKWYSGASGFASLASSVVLSSGVYYVTQTINGCESTRKAVSVTINSTPSPTANDQTFCFPATIANLMADGSIIKWYLTSTGGTALASTVVLQNATTYYASQTLFGCESTTRIAVNVIINSSNNWIGSSSMLWSDPLNWSCGLVPTSEMDVIISEGAYQPIISTDAYVHSLTIHAGAVLKVNSSFDLTVVGMLTNEGTLTLENNANLLQEGVANTNTGVIQVTRNSSALKRLDYTLWSSPVLNQNLQAFSPETVNTRFYSYDSTSNLYVAISSPSTHLFTTAQGYLIRMPNTHPTVIPTIWTGHFEGVPNTGNYVFPLSNTGIGKRFNLIGNPYPSCIDAIKFYNANAGNITGTIYFWRKTNNVLNPTYCTWTPLGGFVTNGQDQVFNPNDVIQIGQGFFVEALGSATEVGFDNTMRVGNNANQFFRTTTNEARNRIWLNLTSSVSGAFSQAMIGYIEGATEGVDNGIDGKYNNDGELALASIIDSGLYAIQGRSLPFNASDIVPLSFRATTAGTFTLAIEHVDGFFSESQGIFVKDNLTNTIHDLRDSNYSFVSDSGTFDNRFEIVYQNALGITSSFFSAANVIINKQNQYLIINAAPTKISKVKIFDMSGRTLAEKNNINGYETSFFVGKANQVLFIQIVSITGETVTKGVVY